MGVTLNSYSCSCSAVKAHNSDYMICNLQGALYEASVWGVAVG